MSTEFKRFTISLTPELEQELDRVKQEKYYNRPQSQMVRDLIARGLESFRKEHSDKTTVSCLKQSESIHKQ